MTFYEAALRVLEAAGQPLNSVEITERSITQGLLSHVGKTPEQTMLSRLAAMARREEIEIMQLVGAPFAYIRGPFIAEGLVHTSQAAAITTAMPAI